MMITSGQIVIGNDGGVYSRPLSDMQRRKWSDLKATLRSWQYYDARAGKLGVRPSPCGAVCKTTGPPY